MTITANRFRKAMSTDATTALFGSFTAKIPTLTEPTHNTLTLGSSANGKYNLFDTVLGIATVNSMPRYIQLMPYGVGANNNTFDMRLWGWSVTMDTVPVYIPQLLLELNVTLGNIDGTVIAANAFLADTIAIAKGDTTSPIISPANDTPASVLAHCRGCRYLEWDFDSTSSSPAMNCWWRMMDQV